MNKTILFDAYLKYDSKSDRAAYCAKNSRKGSKAQKKYVVEYEKWCACKSAIMEVIENLGLFEELVNYDPKTEQRFK